MLGGIVLLISKKSSGVLERYAVPFAAGALLSTVFVHLLPEGVNNFGATEVMKGALYGVVGFFFLERFLSWFHHHHQDDEGEHDHHGHKASLVIVGDTLHNALDGVTIAASFLISFQTGLITTIAVAIHEIPHEIGDFGVLLNKGVSRRRVLIFNFIGALATVVMAVLTFKLGSSDKLPLALMIGLSSGFLLYIAMSDLIPSIHDGSPKKKLLDWRPVLFVLGIIVVALGVNIAHAHDNHVTHNCDPDSRGRYTQVCDPYNH